MALASPRHLQRQAHTRSQSLPTPPGTLSETRPRSAQTRAPKPALTHQQSTSQERKYDYEELIERDNVSLDVTWLQDDSLQDVDDLPEPEVLANDISEDLQAALDQFEQVQTEFESSD